MLYVRTIEHDMEMRKEGHNEGRKEADEYYQPIIEQQQIEISAQQSKLAEQQSKLSEQQTEISLLRDQLSAAGIIPVTDNKD